MSGVIFLDFDGPIFPQKVFFLPENNLPASKKWCEQLNLHPYVEYWKADPIAIAMLNKLYEYYPYELVISSSWADEWLHQKEQIVSVLDINGLNYCLHKDWKTPRSSYHQRHEQIAHWLRNNNHNNEYIVLDDLSSGAGLANKEYLQEFNLIDKNIFLVDEKEGLTYNDYLKMKDIVIFW